MCGWASKKTFGGLQYTLLFSTTCKMFVKSLIVTGLPPYNIKCRLLTSMKYH